ncbi:PLD nuclease N-terminal domain-containing protein [Trueperella bialowiezensis]|uniref:Cardiolipin synthase N-terminal domain-containing protein n=1 Tax=Trueperella bialowiezensis TaxID=312285 RepID=A0A3S4V7F8_9ACTO|nr:PLD nuclease N-terminal domain-containing protein [Trueperella bialowiezensis]VEI13687.1 Uncharacterised protein [Trueperella bialowiezensis]
MARIVPIIVGVALIIYAFIDAARTDSTKMPARISKPLWLLLIAIVPVIGALIWLFFKYQHVFKSDYKVTGYSNPFSRPKKPSGPVAPDDDPEFLARLEARNRRRAYEQRLREEQGLDPLADQDDENSEESDDDRNEGGLYGAR